VSDEHTLILYDGVCGLCHAFVRFLIRRDAKDRFRFAPLQSEIAREVVRRHGGDPDAISTVYFVRNHKRDNESVRTRGKAALYAIDELGGAWRLLGSLRVLPAFVLNLGYGLVAHFRYRLFGKRESCALPDPSEQSKFIA
jgi:predicted DCC family thiol-disulfide oxidoreductase YuxK